MLYVFEKCVNIKYILHIIAVWKLNVSNTYNKYKQQYSNMYILFRTNGFSRYLS